MTTGLVYERTSVTQNDPVMPFYLVCGVSREMHVNIAALNDGLRHLRQAVLAEPMVDNTAQFCIISFSETAKVLTPLGQMSEKEIPTLQVEGGANYGAAFRLLAYSIERDTASLLRKGYSVYRPCVFFITGSGPEDHDWYQTFARTLTYDPSTAQGLKAYPIVVPFGYGSVPEDVLRQLAYPPGRGRWYHARSATLATGMTEILSQIMQTVMTPTGDAETFSPAIVRTGSPGLPDLRISVTRLGPMTLLGTGGLGKVYRVDQFRLPNDQAPLAYKQFQVHSAWQSRSAQSAIAFRESMARAERTHLDRLSAWPQALVEDESGVTCGYLMPLIPPEFFMRQAHAESDRIKSVLREMTWLTATANQRIASGIDLPEIDISERLILLAQLVYVIGLLHKRDWVFGDLSLKNIAFALNPARILLFDCDEAAPLEDDTRRQFSTPFWEPPESEIAGSSGQQDKNLQDKQTDVYKLGLAILRCLTPGKGAASTREVSRLRDELDAEGKNLLARALSRDRASRPTANDLYVYLYRFISTRWSSASLPLPAPSTESSRLSLPGVRAPEAASWQPIDSEVAPTPTGRIFISYRRQDADFPAAWLYDRLAAHFGRDKIFKDIDSIPLGEDFVDVITSAVAACEVLLVLIGHQWLTVRGEDGRRRLDNPRDIMRLEIEAALKRKIPVIPVLIGGAPTPRADEVPDSLIALTRRQALELSPSRFDFDSGRLLRELQRMLGS